MFTGQQGITTAFTLSNLSSVLTPSDTEIKEKKNRIALDQHGRYHWRNRHGDTGIAESFNEARVGVLERDVTRQVHGFLKYAELQFRQEAIQEGLIAVWTFLEKEINSERMKAQSEKRPVNEVLPHTDSYLVQRAMGYARNHLTKEYRHIKNVDSVDALFDAASDNQQAASYGHIGFSIDGERELEKAEATATVEYLRASMSPVGVLLMTALLLGYTQSDVAAQPNISRKELKQVREQMKAMIAD